MNTRKNGILGVFKVKVCVNVAIIMLGAYLRVFYKQMGQDHNV
jgi:hypothetical protein